MFKVFPNFKAVSRLSFSRRAIHDTKVLLQQSEEPLDLPVDRNGGFYPASLRNKLNSNYTIVRKLGWGQHSSVWLAEHEGAHEQQYVAVKILTAHATQVQGRVSDELGLLQSISDFTRSSINPGRTNILALMDSFEISSVHGRHLCLVQEAMGIFPELDGQGLPVPLVKVVVKQLLLALDFLHRECQMIHTDLKPSNILVQLDNVQTEIQGSHPTDLPHAFPSEPILSRPICAFRSNELLNLIQQSKLNVKLTDFGTAVRVNGFHPDIIQPIALRAPEVILGCEWGTSADIWNLGCLIFEFLTGYWLFGPRGGPTWTPEAYHLGNMPAIAGEEFDTTSFLTGKRLNDYFGNDNKLRLTVGGVRSLEEALASYNVMSKDEVLMCTSFLRLMMRLRPSDRASAADLAQHEWLKI